jgi:hypothetical protein
MVRTTVGPTFATRRNAEDPGTPLTRNQRAKRWRQCERKRQHPSLEAAAAEAQRLQRYSKRYTPYRCPWCGGWHVGKRKLR